MHLSQAREEAIRSKVIGTFEITDKMNNTLKCRWINPKEGTFKIYGTTGFSQVDDYLTIDPIVKNINNGGKLNGND